MISRLLFAAQELDRTGMHYAADALTETLRRLAQSKQPWEMTFEEFFDSLKTRDIPKRSVDFASWLKLKGLKEGIDFANADQYATYIGQQTFGAGQYRSKAEKGKQSHLAELASKREAVMRQYEQEVGMEHTTRNLDMSNLSDISHVRVMHKRAIRQALQDGQHVPEHILSLYGMSTKS